MRIDSTSIGIVNRYYYLFDLTAKPLCTGNIAPARMFIGKSGFAGTGTSDTLCISDSILVLSNLLASQRVSANGYWKDAQSNDSLEYLSLKNYHDGESLTLQYIAPGTYGCADTSTFQLYVVDCALGEYEYLSSQLRIYPNPSTGYVRVEMGESFSSFEQIELLDLQGRTLKSFRDVEAGSAIYTGDIPSGVYTLRVFSGNNCIHKVLRVL